MHKQLSLADANKIAEIINLLLQKQPSWADANTVFLQAAAHQTKGYSFFSLFPYITCAIMLSYKNQFKYKMFSQSHFV